MNILFFRVLLISIILVLIVVISSVFAVQKTLKIEANISGYPKLKKKFDELTKEIENTAELYQTTNQLAYWESEGKKSFNALLRSEGYYSSIIDTEILNAETSTIIFHIKPWQRYKLSSIIIKLSEDSQSKVLLPSIDSLAIQKGQFAIAENVIAAQEHILKFIDKNNCLLSLSASHVASINHFDNLIDITFIVDAGPEATIEKVSFNGLKKVKEKYVRKIIELKSGQCFKRSDIVKARGDLQKSGLFASTSPTIPKVTNQDGSVPIIFNLRERKFRSLKAGAGYGTDLGLGAVFGWENRNFFGNGEDLKFDTFINKTEQTVELNYVEPFYKRLDQTLNLGSKFENKKTKAFDGIEGSISGFLEREFTPKWNGGFGANFAQSKVKRDGKVQHYSLLSTPLFLKLDTRKNILNPRSGHEVRVETAPFFTVRSKERPFFKAQISGTKYFAFKSKFTPVLALRGAYGNILGVRSVKLPINEKFYVGGAQSLRGYAYQLGGDLDAKKRPIGGRSFIETSVELRLNITDTIGAVGFLDSGKAYSAIMPNTGDSLLHGAGFGFRYMTDFGPIRIDVGFPLKRRKFVDKAFQLYFGIGQAF
jgi:translocation and assembly module TamA